MGHPSGSTSAPALRPEAAQRAVDGRDRRRRDAGSRTDAGGRQQGPFPGGHLLGRAGAAVVVVLTLIVRLLGKNHRRPDACGSARANRVAVSPGTAMIRAASHLSRHHIPLLLTLAALAPVLRWWRVATEPPAPPAASAPAQTRAWLGTVVIRRIRTARRIRTRHRPVPDQPVQLPLYAAHQPDRRPHRQDVAALWLENEYLSACAAGPGRPSLRLHRQAQQPADVLRETRRSSSPASLPRRLGRVRRGIQLPGVAQLDDRVAGRFRDHGRCRRGASVWVGNIDRRMACSGACSCGWFPPCVLEQHTRSITGATCAIASTGGPTPEWRRGTTRRSSTRWNSPRRMASR